MSANPFNTAFGRMGKGLTVLAQNRSVASVPVSREYGFFRYFGPLER